MLIADDCPICHYAVDGKSTIAVCPCGHLFHLKCVELWFETNDRGLRRIPYKRDPKKIEKCPKCNAEFEYKRLVMKLFVENAEVARNQDIPELKSE
jgi:hypothetical protein